MEAVAAAAPADDRAREDREGAAAAAAAAQLPVPAVAQQEEEEEEEEEEAYEVRHVIPRPHEISIEGRCFVKTLDVQLRMIPCPPSAAAAQVAAVEHAVSELGVCFAELAVAQQSAEDDDDLDSPRPKGQQRLRIVPGAPDARPRRQTPSNAQCTRARAHAHWDQYP